VFLVVLLLDPAATLGLVDGGLHGVGPPVGVQHHFPVDVPGGTAHRLDEGGLTAEESLLVGVRDGHQGDFGDVQPLPQEVDTDEHLDLTEAERPDEAVTLQRVGFVVHIGDVDAGFLEELCEVLGHALCERSDEDPFVLGHRVDPFHQVVDLARRLGDFDFRVDEVGGSNDLFDDLVALLAFVVGGRRGDEQGLAGLLLELLEGERPVVVGGREPEAVLDEAVLSGLVPGVLAP